MAFAIGRYGNATVMLLFCLMGLTGAAFNRRVLR
jgi:hypothetical protein